VVLQDLAQKSRVGEEGLQFYMVMNGSAQAREEGKPVQDYQPGDYFGELALLSDQPRSVDVYAGDAEGVTLAVLDSSSFKRLLGPLSDIMAERASLTLRTAKSHGCVIIVTNAEHGWIEMSCQKFMPSLAPELKDVKILSARSQFECRGVAQPSDWKLLAFRGEIDLFLSHSCGCWTNIISVGDSPHEREALIRVTDFVPNSWAKVLKLVEKPGEEEFLKEHDILRGILGDIVNHDGSLDVSICSP